MSNPFIGEIRMFAGNFAPQGWAMADGQLLPISGNETLFSLIGTTYGGDGQTTFALPDLRGRAPMHMGSGAGLTSRTIGQVGGGVSVQANLQATQKLDGSGATALVASAAPIPILSPYLVVNFIIARNGVFPQQN